MGWTVIAPWKLQDGATQKLTVGAASVASAAVGAHTQALLLSATTNCHVRISNAGNAATVTDTLIKTTDDPLVVGCAPGDKVSVIEDSAAGILSITELTH